MRITGRPDIVCDKDNPMVRTPWLTADRAFVISSDGKGMLLLPAVDAEGDVPGPIPKEVFKDRGKLRLLKLEEKDAVMVASGVRCPRPETPPPDYQAVVKQRGPDETKPILEIRLDAAILWNLVKGGRGKGLVTMEIQIEEKKTAPGRFLCPEGKAIHIEIEGTDATAYLMPCDIKE